MNKRRLGDGWIAAAWLLPFALYLTTLAPEVTTQDSGEFMTAIAYLGSAHSPGYPLFILFAKPFTWLPIGSIAFTINLATASAAALISVLILLLVRAIQATWSVVPRLSADNPLVSLAGTAAGVLMAVSPRLWQQTNSAKPYPLVAALVALILLAMVIWYQKYLAGDHRPGYWFAAAFLAGVGTGAHQLMVLFIPGMVLFVLVADRRLLGLMRDWGLSIGLFLYGMMVQGYLVVRALANCRQNWGDSSSLTGFLWHLLRKGYPEEPQIRSLSRLWHQIEAVSPLDQFGVSGMLLLLVGLMVLWKHARPVFGFVCSGMVMYLVVILGYFNPDQQGIEYAKAFFTPVYVLLAVVIAFGFLNVLNLLVPNTTWLHHPYGLLISAVIAIGMIVPPALGEYRRQNQSHNYLAYDYGVNSLIALPDQAVLITWGDSGAFPLWYLQGVERLREDVDLVHVPHIPFQWYRNELPRLKPFLNGLNPNTEIKQQVVELITAISDHRPVFVDYSTKRSIGFDQAVPFGIVYYVGKKPLESDPLWVWQQYVTERFRQARFARDPDSQAVVDIHRFQLRQAITIIEAQRGERAAQPLIQRLLDSTEY